MRVPLPARLRRRLGHMYDVAMGRPIPPSDRPNPSWKYLRKKSSGKIFVQPAREDFAVCEKIRDAYRPILDQYGVAHEHFFLGSVKTQDAAALHALVRARKPATAYQIGTFTGYSAMLIASALKSSGGGILLACDPEVPHRSLVNPVDLARDAAEALGLGDHIRFVRGWHAAVMGEGFSDKLKRTIPVVGQQALQSIGQDLDFAFIDGDHSASSIVQQFLKVGGVMVFHDVYSWPTVAQAVRLFVDDIYFYYSGTSAFFSLDTSPGQDGLAALERTAEVKHPLLRVRVVSTRDQTPVPFATVRFPGTEFVARAGKDGIVYLFADLRPEYILQAEAAGFQTSTAPLGVSTDGDFAETVVRMVPAGG